MHPTLSRLALVGLASLALSGCLGEDTALLNASEPRAGLERDPKLLVATTRLPAGDPPAKPWFSSERSPDLVFAEARLTPPSTSMLGRVTGSGWSIAKVENLNRSNAAQSFAQAVFGRDLLLYIHGYRESFETAATSTIDLSQGIGFPGVTGLFTWPSAASTFSYVADRESAMWSRDALEDLLTAIAKTPSGGRIHIVAHSMGTLLTLETLRMLRASGGESAMERIGAVVLAAPDIDIDLFARGLERLGPDAKKITVISSTKDRALAVSSRLAGGIVRAGAADRERLEALGVRVADASEFGGGIINHDLFLSNREVQQVVKRAIERS
ncbi:alpha/beta hydrolase [Microvirga arsenatis]|uniref:Alpha/beta hydrolase n=1 Tax=Microvirga arsenatis TaxID=2692265 RepID=A0ABW9Z5S6_9HYPH|nr:alpha/beta hydrolase [Microvirga arsenatis]NBJ11448.1 alpha/beta hydrolase [Microvirga arsenatis]NBJ26286.1 alpha/beta hydrolase [Microvirga arsenatis]